MRAETRVQISQLANHIASQYGDGQSITDSSPETTGRTHQSRLGRSDSSAAELISLLPTGAQVFYCTAALDDEAVTRGETLRRHGYDVTVLSPTLTDGPTVGAELAAVNRTARLDRLRALGVSVICWDPDNPLDTALARGAQVIR
jgi:uncharacterized protein (DUF58 family)